MAKSILVEGDYALAASLTMLLFGGGSEESSFEAPDRRSRTVAHLVADSGIGARRRARASRKRGGRDWARGSE